MKEHNSERRVRKPQSEASVPLHVDHINAKGKKVPAKKFKKKPWTFKRVFLRIILPILLVLTIIIGGIVIWLLQWENHVLDQIEYIPTDTNPTFINESSSIVEISQYTSETSIPPVEDEDIHNFLLIGIDSRSRKYTSDGTGSLADVIMIMSVDNKEGTIKLVTIQRDCYVYIPGHSKPQKINAAMSYGGPELLSVVIENHLRIDLEVTKSEIFHEPGGLNANLAEQNRILGVPEDTYKVTSSGMIHLNGRQAVAYSRIREVGNGVYGRSERQVKVLNALLKKFSSLGTTSKMSAMDDIASMIATNISKKEIKHYAFDFLPEVRNMEIQTMGIPVDGYFRSGMYSDVRANEWSIRPDWNGMIPIVQDFLYGETFEFDRVEEIPKAPKQDDRDS